MTYLYDRSICGGSLSIFHWVGMESLVLGHHCVETTKTLRQFTLATIGVGVSSGLLDGAKQILALIAIGTRAGMPGSFLDGTKQGLALTAKVKEVKLARRHAGGNFWGEGLGRLSTCSLCFRGLGEFAMEGPMLDGFLVLLEWRITLKVGCAALVDQLEVGRPASLHGCWSTTYSGTVFPATHLFPFRLFQRRGSLDGIVVTDSTHDEWCAKLQTRSM